CDTNRSVLSDVIAGLPYQLLAGTGGTLLEGALQKASMAIFVVHDFRTTATDDIKMAANGHALNCFLRLLLATNGLADTALKIGKGQLIGPVPIMERLVDSRCKLPCGIPIYREDQDRPHSFMTRRHRSIATNSTSVHSRTALVAGHG